MTDIQKVASEKISQLAESGKIKEVIEESIEKAITQAIKTEFETYGSITTQIKKAIDEGLQININDLPFETYNQQMSVVVKQRLGNLFAGAASERFIEEIDKTLEPAPREITIVDFVNTICRFWYTDDWNSFDDYDEYATVRIEDHNWSTSIISKSLRIWKQLEATGYRASGENQPNMHLYISDGKIRINHEHKYNPYCFSETEAYVFKLYAAGTTITGIEDFDQDDCNLQIRESRDY